MLKYSEAIIHSVDLVVIKYEPLRLVIILFARPIAKYSLLRTIVFTELVSNELLYFSNDIVFLNHECNTSLLKIGD